MKLSKKEAKNTQSFLYFISYYLVCQIGKLHCCLVCLTPSAGHHSNILPVWKCVVIFYCRLQKPSRDQLQVILGKIRSKINAVDIMVNSLENKASEIDGNVGTLLTTYNSSQSTSDGKTEAYMQHQIACLVTDDADVDATKTKIDNYDTSKDEALTALTAESASSFNYEFANYFHSSGAEFKNNLLQQKRTLQDEYTRVEGLLTDSSAFEEQLLSSSQLEIADLTNEKKDDEWFQFEYSSKQFRKSTAEGPSLSVTSQMHGAFQYFALAAGIFRPKPTFSEQLSSSEMTVKGELLRVTIKRPWFKPGLFDDPDLTYVSTVSLTRYNRALQVSAWETSKQCTALLINCTEPVVPDKWPSQSRLLLCRSSDTKPQLKYGVSVLSSS